MHIVSRTQKDRPVCPQCKKSAVVFRSRRRWWELLYLEASHQLPYRCAHCCVRFYRKAPATAEMAQAS